MKYIYIDESGDLGLSKSGSTVLVISALVVNNSKDLDRIVKNARRNKFRKELTGASEIKANKSSSTLRRYMLSRLNGLSSAYAVHCILYKDMIRSQYLRDNKHKLYNFVAGALADSIIINSANVEARIDKSKGKAVLRKDFNRYFEDKLRNGSRIGKIDIYHSDSRNFSGLQLVDILAWSVFQRFNNADLSYFDLIDTVKFPQYMVELWKK
ncbi:hypothetical protein IX51_07970 [uncultured archaeon]|nr:hypothetical protein IX51_07970 [uncultured archaeon]